VRTSKKVSSGSLSSKEIIVFKGSIDIHCRRGEGTQGCGTQNRHGLRRNPAVYFDFDEAILRQLANSAFKGRPELCIVHIPGMQIELNQIPGGYQPETGCGLYPSQCSYHFPTIQCHFGAETQLDMPAFGNKPSQFGGEDAQPIVGYQIDIFLPGPK
jgi:hypothetical protein